MTADELVVYIGLSLLTFFYFCQIYAAVQLSQCTPYRDTKLSDYLFGEARIFQDIWPFLAIAVLFPFGISVIASLGDTDALSVSNQNANVPIVAAQLYETGAKFIEIYLIVVITLEFTLLYGLAYVPHKWNHLLLIAAALDLSAFLFLGYTQRMILRDMQHTSFTLSWATVVFLGIAFVISLFASLLVVIFATKLNEVAGAELYENGFRTENNVLPGGQTQEVNFNEAVSAIQTPTKPQTDEALNQRPKQDGQIEPPQLNDKKPQNDGYDNPKPPRAI